MNISLYKSYKKKFIVKGSNELIGILNENDAENYPEEAFIVAEDILSERGITDINKDLKFETVQNILKEYCSIISGQLKPTDY